MTFSFSLFHFSTRFFISREWNYLSDCRRVLKILWFWILYEETNINWIHKSHDIFEFFHMTWLVSGLSFLEKFAAYEVSWWNVVFGSGVIWRKFIGVWRFRANLWIFTVFFAVRRFNDIWWSSIGKKI